MVFKVFLLNELQVKIICVTLGEKGSYILTSIRGVHCDLFL